MKKVLIIHTWGIGDWLFFTPVLKAIKENYPSVKIEVLLGTPHSRNIVELYPEVHIRNIVDVRKGIWGMIKAALSTWPIKYDILLFTAGIDSSKADKLAFLIRTKKKVALITRDKKPRFINLYDVYDPSIHRVKNNLKLAYLLGLNLAGEPSPYLPFQPKNKPIPGSVLIHPGSDSANSYKRWPAHRFALVADALLKQGRKVSVILGPSEVELADKFSHLQDRRWFRIYQNLPFSDLLEVISEHEILLNSDSGLGHITAALGLRVVTIFGPGDPNVVRPYTKNSIIVRTSMDLSCMPCIRPGGRYGCKERPCLMSIDPEDVLKVIE